MIPKSQISIERRVSEAISAKLNYDFLCYRGSIMGEAYLSHSISEVLVAFFDQQKYRVRNNFTHPVLANKKKGRNPEVDYIVEELESNNIVIAIEAKWASSSHCTPGNILWDLVRLKALKDSLKNKCQTYFLLAGKKEDISTVFTHEFFKYGTQYPLNYGSRRKKNFPLNENKHHQQFIEKERKRWSQKCTVFQPPDSFFTRKSDDTRSANNEFRFASMIWIIE